MIDKRLEMNSSSGYSFLEMINFLKKPKEEIILMKPIQIAMLRNMKFVSHFHGDKNND